MDCNIEMLHKYSPHKHLENKYVIMQVGNWDAKVGLYNFGSLTGATVGPDF